MASDPQLQTKWNWSSVTIVTWMRPQCDRWLEEEENKTQQQLREQVFIIIYLANSLFIAFVNLLIHIRTNDKFIFLYLYIYSLYIYLLIFKSSIIFLSLSLSLSFSFSLSLTLPLSFLMFWRSRKSCDSRSDKYPLLSRETYKHATIDQE